MNKVTYLFGAGASCNALPIINQIPSRIQNLIDVLSKEEFCLSNYLYDNIPLDTKKTKKDFQESLIDDLNWLLKESKCHASIDTFAKKLFIKRKFNELKRLKVTLSTFFIFEQVLNKPDYRYDAFFASLLTRDLYHFPPNVRVLSWNYDFQFELAFREYTDQDSLVHNSSLLGVCSKHNRDNEFIDKFGIYKINGTCAFLSQSQVSRGNYLFGENLNVPLDIELIELVIKNYAIARFNDDAFCALSFAWEPENNQLPILTHAIEQIKDTCALVVIGYSFPFFNRDIDRKIIGSMTELKRVYFQSPDADNIKERFQALSEGQPIELVTKKDVSQFLLPNEL